MKKFIKIYRTHPKKCALYLVDLSYLFLSMGGTN